MEDMANILKAKNITAEELAKVIQHEVIARGFEKKLNVNNAERIAYWAAGWEFSFEDETVEDAVWQYIDFNRWTPLTKKEKEAR